MAGGYRTVSSGGCRSVKVPDTPGNRRWLGKMNAVNGVTGYPVIQLMTLVETGTRTLLGAAFGITATSELDRALQLLRLLDNTMLVLADRGFDAGDFLSEVGGTGAQFLVRLNASRRPPVLRHLPDGSFTSGQRGEGPRPRRRGHRHLPRRDQLQRLVPPGRHRPRRQRVRPRPLRRRLRGGLIERRHGLAHPSVLRLQLRDPGTQPAQRIRWRRVGRTGHER